MQLPVLAIFPFLLTAPAAAVAVQQDTLTVKTTSGTYTGLVNATTPDVNQWLGIPYAQPPLGRLRFMPPLKAPDYGAHDAKAYKPICMQDSGNRTGVYWELVPEFQNRDPQSEDCLHLNIWAPRKPVVEKDSLSPVIIWVCGGSFKEGGGHALYQVPDQWIQRTQTHIFVTFNYRLNVFGFPGSPVAGKNAGLMDIRLVVEWLRDNIQGFGGDPKRMILYGQSAGSSAVLAYGYANPEDPIVGGLIGSSSGIGANYSNSSSLFHNLAQTAGCANLTSVEELACMQDVDALELQKKTVTASSDLSSSFRPIADGVTIFTNMTERLERGLVAKVPLIAGATYNEPVAFAPFNINDTSPPNATMGISGLSCGAIREANARLQLGLTTYLYLYSGNFSNITPRYWLGGMHSSDIPLVFGTHYQFRGNSTELEWQTSFAMESFWATFAANPSVAPRSHLGQAWPRYTADTREIIVFGNATMPSASSVAPVSLAEHHVGPC